MSLATLAPALVNHRVGVETPYPHSHLRRRRTLLRPYRRPRRACRLLEEKGLIRLVYSSNAQMLYTRATNVEE